MTTPSGSCAIPTSDDVDALVDTSVAVALVVADHAAHASTLGLVGGRRLGLAGHAAFESFSVLSRLPAPARRSPGAIARLLDANFHGHHFLTAANCQRLLTRLGELGIGGGAVYDALVGAAALEHDRSLLTRDGRAVTTYRVLGVRYELLP